MRAYLRHRRCPLVDGLHIGGKEILTSPDVEKWARGNERCHVIQIEEEHCPFSTQFRRRE